MFHHLDNRRVASNNHEVADFIAAGLPVVNSGRSMIVSRPETKDIAVVCFTSWLSDDDKNSFKKFHESCSFRTLICWSYNTPIVAVDPDSGEAWRASTKFSNTTSRHTTIFNYGVSRLLANRGY